MKEIKLLGVKVTPGTMEELHARISELVNSGRPSFVLSGNIHGINLARKLPWLGDFYNRADVIRVDGAGIVWAVRILGSTIPPRLTWADWGFPFAAFLADKKYSVFLLGGPPGAVDGALTQLRAIAPSLSVVGKHHGFFAKTGIENDAVINLINTGSPDILIVGMGMPLQERWILDNYEKIRAKVFITAGAAFEYLSGTLRRCPVWMGRMGFEWLFRLLQDPKRMANRYVYGNSTFFINVLLEKVHKGSARRLEGVVGNNRTP
jgi:N-acetylglucosaminyldiphosphoundecaprenol N-acetyl-beta-D-mannosaminyltransferase